jgi:hypothetical protein
MVDIPEYILCPLLWIPGIKAGMLIRDAKARCPHLTVVPYNFDAYGEVYLLVYHDWSVGLKLSSGHCFRSNCQLGMELYCRLLTSSMVFCINIAVRFRFVLYYPMVSRHIFMLIQSPQDDCHIHP